MPEIAAAAAVVRQVAALTGHPLTAVQTRDLLVATGHDNQTPAFDVTDANIGRTLDLTAAVNAVLARADVAGRPDLVRMTVAQRKAVPVNAGYGRSFYTDTPQDAAARTATIDLTQGLAVGSAIDNETIGATGNNLNSPITFGVDAAFLPKSARFSWTLSNGRRTVRVPAADSDRTRGSLRLLPSEIFGLLRRPLTGGPTIVRVTARVAGRSITERVRFVRPAHVRVRQRDVAGVRRRWRMPTTARCGCASTCAALRERRVRRPDRERHRPRAAAGVHRP